MKKTSTTALTANYRFIILQCALIAFTLLVAVTESQPTTDLEQESFQLNEESEFAHQEESIKPNDRGKDAIIRNKRTIGFLRQLFPGLSQIIDRKIQQITRVVFRVVGRLILRGGTAGGGGTAGAGTGSDGSGSDRGRKISITLPTYPPFEDDEEEDSSSSGSNQTSTVSSSPSSSSTISSSTISSGPSSSSPSSSSSSSNGDSANGESNIATTLSSGLLPSDSQTLIPSVTTASNNPTFADLDGNNQINDVSKRRVNRDVSDVLADSTSSIPTPIEEDLNASEPDKKTGNGLLWKLREMRSKRNPFRLNGQNGAGSGNFIFDVVRLIAGSGTTPEKDEELNAPREEREQDSSGSSTNSGTSGTTNDNTISGSSDDTYGAGIPGPLTRLFVFVNRGISNMIQDLILRLAQTSERVINFKARLITSII